MKTLKYLICFGSVALMLSGHWCLAQQTISTIAEKQDSTINKNITADQVLLDIGNGNALQVGKIKYTLGGGGFQEDNRSFIRVFVCKTESTAKLLNLSVGKAYLIENSAERFKYLMDIDLSLSDKDICKLFGVNKED